MTARVCVRAQIKMPWDKGKLEQQWVLTSAVGGISLQVCSETENWLDSHGPRVQMTQMCREIQQQPFSDGKRRA